MGTGFITRNSSLNIPPFTEEDEGKVLSIINGALTWAVIPSNGGGEEVIEEYRWVITPTKTTVYNEAGTTLKETTTASTWICPVNGTYVVQLHAAGGKGGIDHEESEQYMENYMTYYNIWGGSGGGGGGSGAKIELNLTKGTSYAITVSPSVSKFNTYYCNRGNNGADATINSSGKTGTGGKGGAVGTYSAGMTLMASAGKDGQGGLLTKQIMNTMGFSGGGAGSGYAIKDANDTSGYGTGSQAGTNPSTPTTCAIIIRRKLE